MTFVHFLPRFAALMIAITPFSGAWAQDTAELPGDALINAYLAGKVKRIEAEFQDDFVNADAWRQRRDRYRREYLYMLGLDPAPPRTPLKAAVTGSITQEDYIVDNLHFQSRPHLYVTGNLYRPKNGAPGERLPAVLYVCGHAYRGRDGNKSAYQSHGVWFARHGYVCLAIDTLQLGEVAGVHHGTYKLNRWSWLSRGYTPAGVEAWNGMRAIDYLVSRPDVDAQRIAVTGISGGGAATIWIAAADERVKVAVPISGISDLRTYVCDHVIDGHCDCMFLHNAHRWPWARIAALIAPRALLVVNSDQDSLFPMPGNDRLANQLEHIYRLYGAGDLVDVMTSVGDHAYRKDIRRAAFRFINTHLKNDSRAITDSEVDVHGEAGPDSPVIAPERVRVFPTDRDLPTDAINASLDEHFLPVRHPELPEAGNFQQWRDGLIESLRETCFTDFPVTPVAAQNLGSEDERTVRLRSENHVEFRLKFDARRTKTAAAILLVVLAGEEADSTVQPAWLKEVLRPDEEVAYVIPRGYGPTAWTRRNPPNYVERSHALIGATVDKGRLRDVVAAAQYLIEHREGRSQGSPTLRVAGEGAAGVIAAYAAVLSPGISEVVLVRPNQSHIENDAPQFLNILRTCDIPDVLGLISPRPLAILRVPPEGFGRTQQIYSAAGAEDRLRFE